VALNDLLNQVVRDFVWSWYSDISSSPSFPIAVTSLLHASLAQLLLRASRIDFAAFVVRRILPKVTSHIDQFRQSEIALRGTGLERKLTQSEELDLLLASRYAGKGISKLHPAIDNLSTTFTKQNEEMHLRQLVDRAMPFLLPETDARSTILRVTIREIVTCTVLYPLLDMIVDPDFWNQMIDQVVCTLENLSHSFGTHFRHRLVLQFISSEPRSTSSFEFESHAFHSQEVGIQSSKYHRGAISQIHRQFSYPRSTSNFGKYHHSNRYSQV